MGSKFLLPNRFKTIGWIIFVPSFILGILWLCNIRFEIQSPVFTIWSQSLIDANNSLINTNTFFHIFTKDIYNDIVAVSLLNSLLMLTFVREKNEDEYISKIRLDSLIWATLINFLLLLLAIIFVFKEAFTKVMIFNMFTILILFIIRFNLVLYMNKRQMRNEK